MTTRSPSGRHLGLYKALVHNPYFTEFFRHMCALPAQYGFAPEIWKNAVKIMIEKYSGQLKVNRLRVIHLIEADYNFALRVIWGRRLMWSARSTNISWRHNKPNQED